jgi:diguanylate cyclase (GGDEF)-like protein
MNSPLLARLQHDHKLPSPRGPALAVLRLTQKESASLEELAHAISADPVLTGRILKAANAVRPIGQRPVAALRDAVRLLGFAAVRGLALGFCLLSDHRDGACRAFDYRRYWSDCLLRGLALQTICQMVRVIPVEEGFSLGLLVRIGDLALASAFPEDYAAILARPPAERPAAEKARFGESAASLSAAMLADWGLPEALTDPVAWQDAPEAAPFRDGSRPANLLHAIQLASGVVRICAAEPGVRRTLVTDLLMQGARLAIDPDDIPELVDRVVVEWQDWAALFEVPAGDLPPFAQLAGITELEAEGENPLENAAPALRLRVLVVDDEASLRGFLRAVLEQLGFEVREAGDGAAALAEFSGWQPDLVVTDWLMPGMDGIELVRRLRETEVGKTTFVLLLTQLNDDDKLVEAFAAGVDDFIGKPLKPRVFAARLRAARRVITLRKEIERDRESFQRCAADFAATHRRLQEVAHSDALTGLPHRQQGIALLHRAVLRARQEGKPLACILVTLPSLGPINHAAGRQAGDRLLVQVARTLKAGLRPGDGLCRYGDRSFLIGCPRTTRPVAVAAARRIAGDIGRLCRDFDAPPRVRVEVLSDAMENEDALLDQLEQAPPVAAA